MNADSIYTVQFARVAHFALIGAGETYRRAALEGLLAVASRSADLQRAANIIGRKLTAMREADELQAELELMLDETLNPHKERSAGCP